MLLSAHVKLKMQSIVYETCAIFVHFDKRKMTFAVQGKGGLISESFTLWLESPKKGDKLRPSLNGV